MLLRGEVIVNHLEPDCCGGRSKGYCLTTILPVHSPSGAIIGMVSTSRAIRNGAGGEAIPESLVSTLDYLETNFDEQVSPHFLAERAGMSQARFARLIKRIYGMTPSQLIVQTRLSAASRMLKETTLPISDIALSCGFYDHSALTRSFHAMTGMTPSEVRRSEQKVFAYGS